MKTLSSRIPGRLTAFASVCAFAFLVTPGLAAAEGTGGAKKNAPSTRDNSRVVTDSARAADSAAIKNKRTEPNTESRPGTARDRTMPRDTIADTNLVPARPGF